MTAELLTRASSAWQDLAAQTGPLWNEWRRLWDSLDTDERDPATHPAWQSAWLALHRDSVRDIRVAVCRTADDLLALIPLEVVSAGAGRRSRCTLVVPDEVPLEGASLAVRRDDLPRVLDALLRTPVDRRTASMIEFARVDATHSLVTQQGLTCRVEAAGTRSVIDLPANPADLWAALGSNLCGNLRKARNKWNKLPGARIDALTSEQQLASALARLADVESRSWKAEHGTDLASDAAIRQFFAGALPLLASEGRAVSHVLVADGRDIGAHLALQIGNELLVHKIAFDADYKDCAPGNLLLQHLLDD
ncbi:MAG: GNAT family N-acetyltransferase, partial [Planctomycetaceae bacterium]|nr:GNAT family N-acetyltransferase [Planctomycetaceae bacterium]